MTATLEKLRWARTIPRVARHPRASRDELRAYQGRRLRRLVRHACLNVPFYGALFRSRGIGPEDVRGLEDLSTLPIIGKEELRAAPVADTLATGADPRRLVVFLTSGSTGTPFAIRRSREERRGLQLFRWRALNQLGHRATDRMAIIVYPRHGGPPPRTVRRLVNAAGLFRRESISCLQPVEQMAHQFITLAPDLVNGFPGALAQVAPLLRDQVGGAAWPRFVCAGGEPLLPHQRSRIESGFGAPVFDHYSAYECGLVASECPRGGPLHVCDDNVILEILHEGCPVAAGETGEVVVTSLHNWTMPFIRYRLGDLATQGDGACACGQPFSTIERIQGRSPHYLEIPGREKVHPYKIIGPLVQSSGGWVDQFQLVQETLTRVVLRIKPLEAPGAEELLRVQGVGEAALGPGVDFIVEQVDTIAPGSSGKSRPYISLLNPQPGEVRST